MSLLIGLSQSLEDYERVLKGQLVQISALFEDSASLLLLLAQTEDLSGAPASTIWVLSQGLISMELDDEAFQVVRKGVDLHPGDFLLNFKLGDLYMDAGQNRAAIQYLSVANGLRPENAAVHALLGDTYSRLGDAPRAKHSYQEAIRHDASLVRVWRFIGQAAFDCGDFAEALEAYDRALELFPSDTVWEFERNLVRSFAGEIPMYRIAKELRPGQGDYVAGYTAWVLVIHPEPDQRDPERAIEIAQDLRKADTNDNGSYLIEAAANLRLERPEQALALLSRLRQKARITITNGDPELLRAWGYAQLGDRELAREHLEVASWNYKPFLYDGWEPWKGSMVERLFHEVEALIDR